MKPAIVDLAARIQSDIQQRKLQPGDPYYTTSETARSFQVSGTTANRALQLLTQRRVLVRKQRAGTFIADPESHQADPSLQRVHLVVHQKYLEREGLLADGILIGLQRELPEAELEFNFLPHRDEEAYVEEIVNRALKSSETEAFVLQRAQVGVQRILAESGLPTVVNGVLQPSITGLAHIDRDQSQIGRLLFQHLLQQKCQRLLVVFRDQVTAGDHRLLDAVQQELHAAGWGIDRLTVRCLPADDRAIQVSAQEVLEQSSSKLGILCRSEPAARAIAVRLSEQKRPRKKQPEIVVADRFARDTAPCPFPHIQAQLSPEAYGQEIARMLIQQVQGARPETLFHNVPVELVVP
ncbi:DNA-binding transcriptional repressor MngR [Gimesia panareensis]|uniref:DNA-binding transcriptional repressor MngR n=1 Tax=Gimesia panareensis TaxID=2527978 RepID=A0A517Q6F1_9PLAN|nr:GntR family transcriptional regulator [Gimesia panareensis]QDT27178.1 DNA-binding transcriptional repressor MngR [Gimesia panareensis]